jgi:hypothetical protein
MGISIEISPGELLDRITILEIKSERIADRGKQANIRAELERMRRIRDRELTTTGKIGDLVDQLRRINEGIWELTDDAYARRAAGKLDRDLTEVCLRAFDLNNDRARIKRRIDDELGSDILEEKSFGKDGGTSPKIVADLCKSR